MLKLSDKFSWQEALSDLITDPAELFNLLGLDPAKLEEAYAACRLFPLKVPRRFVERMTFANLSDPLLMQVLPLGIEQVSTEGYSKDPLQEKNSNPVPGLLHKYHGRVLITLTSACAVHCRYCFRRYFPYAENNAGRKGWRDIFNYIQNDSSITEIILSGGDPLSVSDNLLAMFTDGLANIQHVKTLRIHTRLPIVLPERVNQGFLYWIKNLKLKCVIVVHVNHSQEIDKNVMNALFDLSRAGVMLLNQSVLLKNINDNVLTLSKLSETLFAAGVLPYYLHVLDKVQGTHHFDVPLKRARTIHQQLKNTLPGYLVPRLAHEEPGMSSKTTY